jgi:outer membrane protein assembly factor BamB
MKRLALAISTLLLFLATSCLEPPGPMLFEPEPLEGSSFDESELNIFTSFSQGIFGWARGIGVAAVRPDRFFVLVSWDYISLENYILQLDSRLDLDNTITNDARLMHITAVSEDGFVASGVQSGDQVMVRFDADGQIRWRTTFGTSQIERLIKTIPVAGDGLLSMGTWEIEQRLIVRKTDGEGEELWSKVPSTTPRTTMKPLEIMELASGQYLFVWEEELDGQKTIKSDLYNPFGIELGTYTFEIAPSWRDFCFAPAAEGGFVFLYTNGLSEPASAHLVKYSEEGNKQWEQTVTEGVSTFSKILPTVDGGYLLAGRTAEYGFGYFDAYLLKLDANGQQQWQRTYGGAYRDEALDVAALPDGGYMVTGESAKLSGLEQHQSQVFVLRVDEEGLPE